MKRLGILTLVFLLLVGGTIWYYSDGIAYSYSLPNTTNTTNTTNNTTTEKNTEQVQTVTQSEQIRGVWVATAYAIDYPQTATTDPDALKQRCVEILDQVVQSNCTTVYFQVRPAADALYSSELFPWSRYLTGTAGTAPEDGFDPLAYWVEQAHERGLKLEAWINPYRICAGANAQADFAALPENSPARQHPEWVIQCDGGYYFDPSSDGVRQLICDGVREIIQKYEIDGIQFDDYFYPSENFDDAAAYAAYTGDLSLADWRRENVNQLVKAVSEVVHTESNTCVFGISPSGIWRNKGVNAFGGSDTKGYEHYTSSYADSLTWIKNNWIDYICPQIYWEIGNEAADFETLVNWWSAQVQDTDVQLIVGLAVYKIGDSQYGDVWQSDGLGEIQRQLELLGNTSYAFFSYRNLETVDGLSQVLAQ